MSIEASCLCEFPIMVGEFEGAFWAWKVCDLVVHCSGIGFVGVNVIGFIGCVL